MAKVVHCAFCGKERKTGFFTGEDRAILTGGEESITCCADCCDRYELKDKQEQKRFNTKFKNYKKTNGKKKVTQQELVDLYLTYLREMQDYQARTGREKVCGGFIKNNPNGYFFVTEFALDSILTDGDMKRSLEKHREAAVCAFDRSDISRLEYRLVNKLGAQTDGLFTDAFMYEVYLNDPRVMTYKPCVTYMVCTGTGFLPHEQRKRSEKALLELLASLKEKTGTDAQIVKIKKFR